ncbi:MAG: hypothetical protein EOO27_35845, partial [Comamonadaceae bacterium]
MHSPLSPSSWFSFIAAAASLLCAQGAAAQVFSADYGLSRPSEPPAAGAESPRAGLFSLGSVQIGPALQADDGYSGAGLSLATGRNWFAQVSVGRSLQHP